MLLQRHSNNNSGCDFDVDCVEFLLNDDAINGDLEANDGIFTVIDTIDTDELESGECLSYVAAAYTEQIERHGAPYRVEPVSIADLRSGRVATDAHGHPRHEPETGRK